MQYMKMLNRKIKKRMWIFDLQRSHLHYSDRYLNSKQIDLSYYHLFGSLKIVLLKSSRIANKQEVTNYALATHTHTYCHAFIKNC